MPRKTQDLTPAERRFLIDSAPDAVARFVAERRDLDMRLSAYSKVAATARAERSALMEVHLLQLASMAVDPSEVIAENERLRSEVTALRARPAMAIDSGRD